jgi:hypothetical protein
MQVKTVGTWKDIRTCCKKGKQVQNFRQKGEQGKRNLGKKLRPQVQSPFSISCVDDAF